MSTEAPKYLGDPNPAVKVTILFEQGNGLVWKLEKPWDQTDLFMEIGLLAAKHDLGIDFDFPVGDEGDETAELLKDLKYWLEADLFRDLVSRPTSMRSPVAAATGEEQAQEFIVRIGKILEGGDPDGGSETG